MTENVVVNDVIRLLERKYGTAHQQGRGRVLTFGSQITCSVNYSKLLGHKFFFAVPTMMRDTSATFPDTSLGEFVVLICGTTDAVLVLPRSFVIEMLANVPKGRVDIFVENGAYVFQTTKKPKIDVTEFLNAFPKPTAAVDESEGSQDAIKNTDRNHVRIQWSLIRLGLVEGCKVWVPVVDRALGYDGERFASHTIERLPNFGFDHKTTRIVQNIDVLWLNRNVIRKAFEIESTTSVYSGLLRLNDLVLSQPNNNIDLFIAASQSRRGKVHDELIRPTFRALVRQCQFVSFESVDEQWSRISKLELSADQRMTNLIRGERLFVPEHYE